MKMRQHIRKNLLKAFAIQMLLMGMLAFTLPPAPVAAAPSGNSIQSAGDQSDIRAAGLPKPDANQDTIKTALQIVFGIIGAFAVLNITLSGLKYITSAGDPQKTSEAKNGIVYSLVGLMIAITAEAIVAFVVNGVGK